MANDDSSMPAGGWIWREAFGDIQWGAPRTRNFGSHAALAARRADGSEFRADVSLSPVVSDEGLLVVATIRELG